MNIKTDCDIFILIQRGRKAEVLPFENCSNTFRTVQRPTPEVKDYRGYTNTSKGKGIAGGERKIYEVG